MNPVYLIGVLINIVLFSLLIATFSSLSPKDTANNSKLLSMIVGFSATVSIFSYGLALYYFSRNPEYLLQFLLATTFLVVLPGLLIGASVATVTISNLRDVVANS
jgi:membrane protein insertase Oxa1/YidC/SpoIIIJ